VAGTAQTLVRFVVEGRQPWSHSETIKIKRPVDTAGLDTSKRKAPSAS
jgi:hypothetical protein